MLEAPLLLLARAEAPPPPPPPNAPPLPLLLLGELETLRFPTLSPPPEPARVDPALLSLTPAPPRSEAFLFPALRSVVPACAPPACRDVFCRAFVCRADGESPRAEPPYLFAVARSEYGAPPRCWELCCHDVFPLPTFVLPPPTFVRLPPWMLFTLLELLTKLLLWLM